jgi:DNA-binding response OmpR family regulator
MGLLAEIRSCDANAPWDITAGVIVAGAQVGELDVLRAFEWGADDFMAYPPRYLELRARLCALLRRTGDRTPRRRLNVGLLEVDTLARTAQLRGQPVALSRLEFALLTHLASEPERVFTRQELLGEVWGFRSPSRTLDSHACRLRRKLAWSGERWVVNVRGVGYRLHDRSSARPSRS